MTHWLQVPYISGNRAVFSQLVADARTSNKRIALVGDSQEDTTSESTCVNLSFLAWQKLGRCFESCIMPPFNQGTSADTSLFWCSACQGVSPSAKVTANSLIPMGQTVIGSGTYSLGTVRYLLAYKADTNVLQAAGDYQIIDPSAGCVADIFLYTNSAGPAEIKWSSAPVAIGPSSGSMSAVVNATALSSGLGLNGTSGTAKRFRTGTMPYNAAKPYHQLIVGGHDGTSYVAGAEMAGARIISLAGAGGLVWEPFSVTGYSTDSVLANHSGAGPMFNLMGGPDGWSGISIGLCNNNAFSLHDDPATYKTKLSALITLLRSWTGTTTPVLLLADPPTTGSGWFAGSWDSFNGYAAVQAELANELTDVMAINTQRMVYDQGYDPSVAEDSTDGIHPTPKAALIRASVIVNALFSEARGATAAEIVAAINADATQITQQTNAATAATQSTAAAIDAATAATQATAAALDASKIPRLTDAIAAGAAVRRNKVAATSTTLDETLEATP